MDSCGRTGAALTPTLTLDDSRVHSSPSLLMIGMGLNNHQGPRYTYKNKNSVVHIIFMAPKNQQRERNLKEKKENGKNKPHHSLRGCSHPAERAVVVLTLLIDVTKDVLRLDL